MRSSRPPEHPLELCAGERRKGLTQRMDRPAGASRTRFISKVIQPADVGVDELASNSKLVQNVSAHSSFVSLRKKAHGQRIQYRFGDEEGLEPLEGPCLGFGQGSCRRPGRPTHRFGLYLQQLTTIKPP